MLQTAVAQWNGDRLRAAPHAKLSLVPAAKAADQPAPVSTVNHQPVLQSDFSELVKAVATARDRDAFARLFDHYAPRLKSFLMRQGADDTQAEDIAQETMLAVWRKAAMFDPAKASAGTWIFTIARNLRIDAIRKARRPEFDPDDPAFVPDPERPADEAMDAEQMGRKVRAALAELPEEQAAVVRLSFFEDKPHAEIAEQLALPLGTVKSRLRLAMRRIKSFLGDNE
ncbi:MAG: sigma-70 family RNA polymerase sigma factor [Rhodospirillaceae bacterium]|nr:sigma-70 family RNA polymerase sigma factor [Rhodospirillaceae bacterium]